MRVVVDTNIAFCALAAGCGDLGFRLMSPSEITFYAPRFLFVELFKHKDRIIRASKLPEECVLTPAAFPVPLSPLTTAKQLPIFRP